MFCIVGMRLVSPLARAFRMILFETTRSVNSMPRNRMPFADAGVVIERLDTPLASASCFL
jgi:hypothetical protein